MNNKELSKIKNRLGNSVDNETMMRTYFDLREKDLQYIRSLKEIDRIKSMTKRHPGDKNLLRFLNNYKKSLEEKHHEPKRT